jgi:hypothetical protein
MRGPILIIAALLAFGLGWALSWAAMPWVAALRGTAIETPANYTLLAGIIFLAPVVIVGLVCIGKRVRYLLPVGCIFLLGGGMARIIMLPQTPGELTPILPPAEAFGQIIPLLLEQWPLKLAFLCCAAALCATWLLAARKSEEKSSPLRTALILGAVLAIGLCTFFVRDPLGSAKLKQNEEEGGTLAYYRVVGQIKDFRSFLRFYEQNRDALREQDRDALNEPKLDSPYGKSLHVWSNMPGKTFMYYLFYKFRLKPDEVRCVIIVLYALAAIPIFFIMRRMASEKVAIGATVLFFLLPGPPLLFPSSNTTTVLLALLGLWMVLVCLEKRDAAIGFFVGLYLAIFFFYEPLPFVLALLLIPYIWRAFRANAKATAGMFAALLAGFVVFWAAIYLWSDVSFFKITSDTIKRAARFNEIFHRDYKSHLLWNFGEVGAAVGWATALLWAFGAGRSARELFRRGGSFLKRIFNETQTRGAALVFSLFLLILILDVSGASRGEVGRLWLFLMPFVAAGGVWSAE